MTKTLSTACSRPSSSWRRPKRICWKRFHDSQVPSIDTSLNNGGAIVAVDPMCPALIASHTLTPHSKSFSAVKSFRVDAAESRWFAREATPTIARSSSALVSTPQSSTPASRSGSTTPQYVHAGKNKLIAANRVNKKPPPPPPAVLAAKRARLAKHAKILNNVQAHRNKTVKRRKVVEKPCRFWTRTGICQNGNTCPYQHDPQKTAICPRFVSGDCPNTPLTCPLSHDPTPERMPLCLHFQNAGRCRLGSACPYPHVFLGDTQKAGVCRDFAVLGYCARGIECERNHVRECPDFAERGVCATKGCKLPHVIRASRGKMEAAKVAALVKPEEVAEAQPEGQPQKLGDEFVSLMFEESEDEDEEEDVQADEDEAEEDQDLNVVLSDVDDDDDLEIDKRTKLPQSLLDEIGSKDGELVSGHVRRVGGRRGTDRKAARKEKREAVKRTKGDYFTRARDKVDTRPAERVRVEEAKVAPKTSKPKPTLDKPTPTPESKPTTTTQLKPKPKSTPTPTPLSRPTKKRTRDAEDDEIAWLEAKLGVSKKKKKKGYGGAFSADGLDDILGDLDRIEEDMGGLGSEDELGGQESEVEDGE
ncbi:unnamed protein product, partial [Rhizoctonia solani]